MSESNNFPNQLEGLNPERINLYVVLRLNSSVNFMGQDVPVSTMDGIAGFMQVFYDMQKAIDEAGSDYGIMTVTMNKSDVEKTIMAGLPLMHKLQMGLDSEEGKISEVLNFDFSNEENTGVWMEGMTGDINSQDKEAAFSDNADKIIDKVFNEWFIPHAKKESMLKIDAALILLMASDDNAWSIMDYENVGEYITPTCLEDLIEWYAKNVHEEVMHLERNKYGSNREITWYGSLVNIYARKFKDWLECLGISIALFREYESKDKPGLMLFKKMPKISGEQYFAHSFAHANRKHKNK